MAVLIDIPQVAYRTWAIDVYTGDRMLDYKLERELEKTLTQYPYSKDHVEDVECIYQRMEQNG